MREEISMNDCPVCGYPEFGQLANHKICVCCGTQFGLDDFERTLTQLTNTWIERGAPWFSDQTRPPRNWNPARQLAEAGLLASVALVRGQRAPEVRKTVLFKSKARFELVAPVPADA